MSRRLLLCSALSGPDPVLRALALCRDSRVGPVDELHALAMGSQRESLERALLDTPRRQGAFARRCRELGIPRDAVTFNRRSIHVATNADGQDVAGLTRQADIDALAEFVFAQMRRARSEGAALTVVIDADRLDLAGHFLLAAIQVAGRACDRAFLIPGSVEIPLVLPTDEPDDESYVWLARRRRRELEYALAPPALVLDDASATLVVDDLSIPLTPSAYFWYSGIATWNGEPPTLDDLRGLVQPEQDPRLPALSDRRPRLLQHLQRRFTAVAGLPGDDLAVFIHKATVTPPNLVPLRSKLNKRITLTLGCGAAPYLLVLDPVTRGYRTGVRPTFRLARPAAIAGGGRG